MKNYIFLALVIALTIFGCSSNATTPASPDVASPDSPERHHALWGFWQGVIDPQAETVEFVPLRTSELHLNALPFLEPPPYLNLTIESLAFDGDIIDVDIGLRHPFLGLVQFTGFDVCGIFITNGSVGGFTDSALMMAGEGETRLLNADGYSRWWNPAEFPNTGKIFGYTDGLLGAPDSVADYNSTLNGYKYFCDDLVDPNDPLSDVGIDSRGMFSAGQKNVRHYTIQMEDGLIFNYAIDASWKKPVGVPPYTAPDDFSEAANRAEAWRITVTETENSLWNDGIDNGGDLSLLVDVYDWYNADLNTLRVESPGNLSMVESSTAIGGGEGYSTYAVEIPNATPAEGEIELLISVISDEEDFEGFISGVNTTAYFIHTSEVGTESFLGFEIFLDANHSIDSEFYDFAPSVIVNPAGDVYVTYSKHYDTLDNSTTDYALSVDSGLSWTEPIFSAYVTTASHPMLTTAVLDPLGDVYHLINMQNTSIWSLIVKFSGSDGMYGVCICKISHGHALAFTYEGYPLGFGDYGGYVNVKKGDIPYSPHVVDGGWDWDQYDLGTTVIPSPARLAHTRNNARDSSNSLYLIFFSSNSSDTWIRLAVNTDGNGMTWDYDNDVYDGASDGYDVARDPSIWLDTNETWHSAFILHTNSPASTESIAYCRTTDPYSWSEPAIACSVPGVNILDDPTVDTVQIGEHEIIVITYLEDDKVYIVYSWDEGNTWQPPTLLSTDSDELPDTCVSPDGYVHTVWEHDEGADRRVDYIRAHFEEM